MGLPNLTLDATVGLHAAFTGGSTKTQSARAGATPGQTDERSYSNFAIDTASFHQPWNIFITNVAAIYYF
jgi:hypothetical protein